jgi:copper chaperone
MSPLTLKIAGMTCDHCVSRVTRALSALDGVSVQKVEVGAAQLEFEPTKLSQEAIARAVDELGFEARIA